MKRIIIFYSFLLVFILFITNPYLVISKESDLSYKNMEQKINELEVDIIRLKAISDNYQYLKEETKEYRSFIEKEREHYQSYIENLMNKAYWFIGITVLTLGSIFTFLGLKTWTDFKKKYNDMLEKLKIEAEGKLRKSLDDNLTQFVDERLNQKIEPIQESVDELQHFKRSPLIKIDGLPSNYIPDEVVRFYCMPLTNKSGEQYLYLLGEDKQGELHHFGDLEFKYYINPAKSSIYFSDDKIFIYSQKPFSMQTFHAEYLWDGEKANLIKEGNEDSSAEAVKAAREMIDIGNISGALKKLEYMMYPKFYYESYEMTISIIESAHRFALEAYKSGNTSRAVELLKEAFNTSTEANVNICELIRIDSRKNYEESNFVKYLSLDEYLNILNSYGFFLEKVGEKEEAAKILDIISKIELSKNYLSEPK